VAELGDVASFVARFGDATVSVWPPLSPDTPELRAWWDARDRVARVAPLEGQITRAAALEYFARGATLYYKRLERHDVGLAAELYELAAVTGLPRDHAAIEAFVSPAGKGATMHFDADYGFNVQVLGAKTWTCQRNTNIRFPVQSCSVVRGPA